MRVEELAVTAVLDERGAIGVDLAARDGVSERTIRSTIETARALEGLPEVTAAAHEGRLSAEQLAPVAELADERSDAEWARRAANCAPADLARLARRRTAPTEEEGRARRAARSLSMWWQRDSGMLSVRALLPDIDGAVFESVINQMVDGMRPSKGEQWDTRAHRGADALLELAASYTGTEPVGRPRAHLVVQIPIDGPAEVAGIPLPAGMVESLRAEATLEPVSVDADGAAVVAGRGRRALSPKITRAVLLRDGHCRWPGCDRRTGLQVHHLIPLSWGGSDEISNLAAVCVGGGRDHHGMLVPHGRYLLEGNPNQPDGLRLTRCDTSEARAGPAWLLPV